MKRLFSLLLALLLFFALPLSARAATVRVGEERTIGSFEENAMGLVVVDEDGTAWYWGPNWPSNKNTRHRSRVLENVVSVNTYNGDYAAILADGSLWTWGWNDRGELGNGELLRQWEPTPRKILDDAAAVLMCANNAFAIGNDGSLWAWGDNSGNREGLVGCGSTEEMILSPVKILDDVIAVSSSGSFTALALKQDGTLWSWGSGEFGGLGNGSDGGVCRTPVQIMDQVTDIATTHLSSAALRADGTLWGWGHNYNCRFGDDEDENISLPRKLAEDVASFSLSTVNLAVIKKDGSLWMSGDNVNGELAQNTGSTPGTLVRIMDDVAKVRADMDFVYALKTDGTLWSWGYGSNHELGQGNGYLVDKPAAAYVNDELVEDIPWGKGYSTRTPTKIMDGVADVSMTYHAGYALRTDGSLWAWGLNNFGDETVFDIVIYSCSIAFSSHPGTAQSVPAKLMDNVRLPDYLQRSDVLVKAAGRFVRWPDARPFINADGRTLVPLRAVAEALGLTVSWDSDAREASFTDGQRTITFPIGSSTARTTEGTLSMDTAAVIVSDRSYAPIRYLAEYFGYAVSWEGSTRCVLIQ